MKSKYKSSESSVPAFNEDDGSVFVEEKGVLRNIPPGELVRACGITETLIFKASMYGQSNTVMQVWIASKLKIESETIKNALHLLSRQVPQLQFCFSKRRNKLWFKRMVKLELDFETSVGNEMEVLVQMLDTTYDKWNGPLWKARLIQSPQKRGDEDKFSAVLIFSILHSINDGVTNMKIAQHFVSIMNHLIAGKKFSPSYSLVIDPCDKIAQEAYSAAYGFKKSCSKVYSMMYRKYKIGAALRDCFPTPFTKELKIRVLIDNFTKTETEAMAKMCKKENVTINTFILTVINFVLLSLVNTEPGTAVTKNIIVSQAVNLRRHFNHQYEEAPGSHSSIIENQFKCSTNSTDHFWSIARKNQFKIKNKVEMEMEQLKNIPYINAGFSTGLWINDFLARHGHRTFMPIDYSLSNMGNLNRYFPEPNEDDNVEITYLTRSVTHNMSEQLFGLSYQSLRGILILSMDYYPHQMREDIAEEFFRNIFEFVRNMITY